MTPQFTTPCYIKIDDAQQRKEVSEKLNAIGYNIFGEVYDTERDTIFTHLYDGQHNYTNDPVYEINKNHRKDIFPDAIDCGTNEALFLDLAAMRSDTDKGQLFICHKALSECQYMVGEMSRCYDDKQPLFINPGQYLRRATAQEIIEWHKQKGETNDNL